MFIVISLLKQGISINHPIGIKKNQYIRYGLGVSKYTYDRNKIKMLLVLYYSNEYYYFYPKFKRAYEVIQINYFHE